MRGGRTNLHHHKSEEERSAANQGQEETQCTTLLTFIQRRRSVGLGIIWSCSTAKMKTYPAGHSGFLISSHSSCSHEVSPVRIHPHVNTSSGDRMAVQGELCLSLWIIRWDNRCVNIKAFNLYTASCSWYNSLLWPDSHQNSGRRAAHFEPPRTDPCCTHIPPLGRTREDVQFKEWKIFMWVRKRPLLSGTQHTCTTNVKH